MKIAIYTSIFGGYDNLHEDQIQMDGVDYICFTDSDIKSDVWNIVKSTPIYNDPNRNAKKYKILPHRYLSEYDYSIWIDGNFNTIADIRQLCTNEYQVFDHNKTLLDPRNCVYKEYQAIIELGKRGGNFKDNPEVMYNQIKRYADGGYPPNNGLASNGIIFRNHNNPEVIKVMEDWWLEIKHNSKRDQLSFDYIAWKNQFKVVYLDGDIRKNKYFIHTGKHRGKK